MNNKITHVYALGGKRLALRFDDGHRANLDFSALAFEGITASLAEDSYFQRVRVEGSTIAWPNDYDICPDVLRLWCDQGRVLTDEETNAAFTVSA